jgi:hypothetical protein
MFKRVTIGLFAISVVAMLWTEANADCPFDFTYCYNAGGSEVCGCYNAGSINAIGNITCPKNNPRCGPFRFDVKLFGNVPTNLASSCNADSNFNPKCGMSGHLRCDDANTLTILSPPNATPVNPDNLPVAHVTFPLTGKADINCHEPNKPYSATIKIDVNKCNGNTANCCPDCCPPSTKIMTFTPDTPKAFDARATYSQNRGAKTRLQTVIVDSADCNLKGGLSTCDNSCTFSSKKGYKRPCHR